MVVMASATVASTVRLCVLILGALNVGAALAVLRAYFAAYCRAPRNEGLLPLHVITIALGYITIQVPLVAAMADQADAGINWRIPTYGAGQLLVLVALGIVARLQTRKVHNPQAKPVIGNGRHRGNHAGGKNAPGDE